MWNSIVRTPPPPITPLSHLGGGLWNFLLEREDKPQKGGLPLFYYFTVQSHLLCVGGKQDSLYYFLGHQSFKLAMQNSHPSLYCTKTLYLVSFVHFWSILVVYKKILTALFNLVWNTQKSKCTIFFECQAKMLLSNEKVLEKISKDPPKMHCLIIFLHIFKIKVPFLLSHNLII